jgi:CysZ protein
MGRGMIFTALAKAIGQIGDRAFLGVLLRALGLTILLLAGVVWLLAAGMGWLLPDSLTLPLIGEITWVDDAAAGVGVVAGLVLSVVAMVPVASLFVGLFLDEVAGAVEARHYPHLPRIGGAPFWAGLRDALRFLGVVVVANLLALILYVIFVPLAPLIFWSLNGFLLGREYFQLVALRRVPEAEARRLRRRHGLTIFLAGLMMAVPLTVPVLGLIVPILGVAVFTHLFHGLR